MKGIRRALVLVPVLALLLAANAHAAAFKDVPPSHWAYQSVSTASELGLVNGVGGGAFGLGAAVTRAQYATMLCRLMDWEPVCPEQGSFSDNLDPAAWYYCPIETALENGALVKLDDACGVNEPLPREEMAAMTVRALGYAALAGVVQDDCVFSDVLTNPGYIALAHRMGFMNGVSASRFSPRTASTREQAAAVLLRVYEGVHADLAVNEGTAPPDAVRVPSMLGLESPLPISPRAPLESVYDAAVQAGKGGAVVLSTAPHAQTVRGETVSAPVELSDEAFAALLQKAGAQVYSSARHRSSYLVDEANGERTVVWYESEDNVREKLDLCRLLGVKTVYLQRHTDA